jgi:hypothetical protein
LAIHFGLGNAWLRRDDAARLARDAEQAAGRNDWPSAAASYTSALAVLPGGRTVERRQLEVAQGRSLVMSGDVIEGQQRLEETLHELDAAGQEKGALARDARAELATASYYAAWIMRLEGAAATEWMPEADRARQQFRLLAERTTPAEGAELFQRNLEATIRLEQMDQSEILARPLPKNCPKCKQSLCQRKRKQSASRCNSAGQEQKQPKPGDQEVRREMQKNNAAGLYSGERPGS